MSYTQIYYHLVWSTQNRVPALGDGHRDNLFRYMTGILKNLNCHLYRIGGIADHIHLLTSLNATLALADLIRELKIGSSKWVKSAGVFPVFEHWQEGCGAFTVSHTHRDAVIEYIKNQEAHHRKLTFAEELQSMLAKAGIQYESRFLQ